MKVFIDLHHEELHESLRILFEDRLGYEVYSPIGLEWWQEGYWSVYNHPSTAEQYLGYGTTSSFRLLKPGERLGGDALRSDSGEMLRYAHWNPVELEPGTYQVVCPVYPEQPYRAATLDYFRNTKFDILVASIPEHIEPFKKLIKLYQPQAKLIFQVGNNWPFIYDVQNVLAAATQFPIPDSVNKVYFHPEFDTKLFSPSPPIYPRRITNMMHYVQEPQTFEQLKIHMPGWEFRSYGAGNADGSRGPPISDIAQAFKEMAFLWHVKKEGDGYGYNIMHAIACGRPLIVRQKYFHGMTASKFLVDGETCFDIDKGRGPGLTVQALEYFVDNYEWISQRVYDRFRSLVNFDVEEQSIQEFISRLR